MAENAARSAAEYRVQNAHFGPGPGIKSNAGGVLRGKNETRPAIYHGPLHGEGLGKAKAIKPYKNPTSPKAQGWNESGQRRVTTT